LHGLDKFRSLVGAPDTVWSVILEYIQEANNVFRQIDVVTNSDISNDSEEKFSVILERSKQRLLIN
jgi:hypothetical protein